MKNDWFIEFVLKHIREHGPEREVVVIYEDDNGKIEDYQINWFYSSMEDLYLTYGKRIKTMKLKDLLNELVL
ncbi:hypothetical protein [Alkalibacterium sp. 20]|uniref:hypothetical protein n=1 Tax=Alkalibacterium sp. 20 TaxID=1798803 RepID=UPI0009000D9D|nr:hypothetical protein [Alkalibacterium sp. 20]OJF92657.1 hypothetical protein AX762_09875 [Alkalibacterium sp. 20]